NLSGNDAFDNPRLPITNIGYRVRNDAASIIDPITDFPHNQFRAPRRVELVSRQFQRIRSGLVLSPADYDQSPGKPRQDTGEKSGGEGGPRHDPVSDSDWVGLRMLGGLCGGTGVFTSALFIGFGDGSRRLSARRRGLGLIVGLSGLCLMAWGFLGPIWAASQG